MFQKAIHKNKNLPVHVQWMIQGGENEKLDFKKEITSPAKIARTMVSFANHKGGTLLIGVNDDKSISGIHTEEEKHMIHEAAERYCKPNLHPDVTEHPLKKKSVMEVTVAEGNHKPYYARDESGKWWVYIRSGDQSLLASKVMLEVLKRGAQEKETLIHYSQDEKNIFNLMEAQGNVTLKQICKSLKLPRHKVQVILTNLISIGLIKINLNKNEDLFSIAG